MQKAENTIWDPVNKGNNFIGKKGKKIIDDICWYFFSCLRVWLLVEKPDGWLPDLGVLLCGQAV
jgi:hypothetical protein